jgi:hypothetical protein
MRLTVDDVTVILNEVELPADLRERLRGSIAEVWLSDTELLIMNDACIARVQQAGFGPSGSINDVGRRLEQIVDKLNAT